MALPHKLVPSLMDNLFNWMNEVKDTINPFILSSIFHYEFVFIHHFHGGNGRTARLWQTTTLLHWEKAFTYLMNNSKEMKDKSILLLSENELKIIECIKKDVIIGAKEIIEQIELSDSTVRRILGKFLQDKKIETTDDNKKYPNKKYKLTE